MVSLWAEMDLGTPDQAKAYWVTMGHIGQVPSEVNVYAKAAREAGKAGTICEVGACVSRLPMGGHGVHLDILVCFFSFLKTLFY